ncbi:hypothetical protein [Mycobacterium persicum]|uniref:ESX-1 secretion-associated protein EspK n=1 Tax=Mycobacterium persicum TaxID=1487726 RepID=A0AB38UVY3_9MYCO|nr:hypothetical protein [Mycobacterium persicum]ORB89751.1 hypothetical protein B1T49_11555 [Mycobacterium persicum]VAZ84892.1 hypothetical protein LAUMK42_03720 [Mycobacterium persicum]
MNTITRHPDPTPPPGAEPDIWEADGHRDVYASVGCVFASSDLLACPLVTAKARQDRAGVLEQICVEVDAPAADLTPEQARELAAHLLHAAGIVDRWAGNTNAAGRLDAAKIVVLQAYLAVRELPGNGGDYLRSALDSIADAEAVLR